MFTHIRHMHCLYAYETHTVLLAYVCPQLSTSCSSALEQNICHFNHCLRHLELGVLQQLKLLSLLGNIHNVRQL